MTIPLKVRGALRQREDGWCARCGHAYAYNAHHRKNRSQGGADVLSNLLLLCGSGTTGCHGWVTEHPAEAYENGWSVRQATDPAGVPVMYRGEWVTLDDLGNLHRIPEVAATDQKPCHTEPLEPEHYCPECGTYNPNPISGSEA